MIDPRRLLETARDLLSRADTNTLGMWPRATALLTRQALEDSLDTLWRRREPGLEHCSGRAQLLCLPSYLSSDADLARRVAYAWSGLSRACHQHAYELPPTAEELAAWLEIVEQLTTRVEKH
jgi:hypothetical protein